MPQPKVLTGARAIISIEGNIVAFATSVSYTLETDYQEIREIDSSRAIDLAPTKLRYEVTCSNIRVPNNSPASSGISANLWSHMKQPYCSIAIMDRNTDATILFFTMAMLVRREGKIDSRGIATEVWMFRGLAAWDECEPNEPPTRWP